MQSQGEEEDGSSHREVTKQGRRCRSAGERPRRGGIKGRGGGDRDTVTVVVMVVVAEGTCGDDKEESVVRRCGSGRRATGGKYLEVRADELTAGAVRLPFFPSDFLGVLGLLS